MFISLKVRGLGVGVGDGLGVATGIGDKLKPDFGSEVFGLSVLFKNFERINKKIRRKIIKK